MDKKALVKSILLEVVFPTVEEISKELGLNEEKKYKLKIQGGKLAIRLLLDIELAKEFVLDLIQEYKQKEISEELIIKYIEKFFELYENWRRKFKNSDENIFDVENLKDLIKPQDDFFFFEGEGVDEIMDDMHYEEHQKISSKEFFENNEMDTSDIADLIDLKEELENFDITDLKTFAEIIKNFASDLKYIYEYKELNYAFEYFVNLLENVDIEKMETEKKEHLLLMLNELKEDIINWIDMLFIKKDALDIHYFDASFLANITQMEMLIQRGGEMFNKIFKGYT
jgi:hypothetical protein